MYYLLKDHRFPLLLLLICLVCLMTLTAQSPVTSARAQGGAPLRLRLTVAKDAISLGDTTKVFAEILDRDYRPVPNDSTRVIEFAVESGGPRPVGAGEISPRLVTIKPGAQRAETTFVPRQLGRVLLSARTAGLDPARTLLVVTPAASSFLAGWFETVAYAQDTEGFAIWPATLSAPANGSSRAEFQVSFPEVPPPNTWIRISVDPPATIIYKDKDFGSSKDINLAVDKATSEQDLSIRSGADAMSVKVVARVLPRGPSVHAFANFTEPAPSKIVFTPEKREISSNETSLQISVELADVGSIPVPATHQKTITFSSGIGDGFMKFDPPAVVLKPRERRVSTTMHWTALPLGNELKINACAEGLDFGEKTILVHSPIEKIMISGPAEVTRGRDRPEFTIHLADKDGKQLRADTDRDIHLSVTSGSLSANQVKIRKGEMVARVQYKSSAATGTVRLTADSDMLAGGSLEIRLVTAQFWLVVASLFGGLFGGIARQIFGKGKFWEPVLARRIAGGLLSGLFCYLAAKFGLLIAGQPALPASVDTGITIGAFFLGGVGGYRGHLVFVSLGNVFTFVGDRFRPKKKAETSTARPS